SGARPPLPVRTRLGRPVAERRLTQRERTSWGRMTRAGMKLPRLRGCTLACSLEPSIPAQQPFDTVVGGGFLAGSFFHVLLQLVADRFDLFVGQVLDAYE